MIGDILLASFATLFASGAAYVFTSELLDWLYQFEMFREKFQTWLMWALILLVLFMASAIALNPWFTWYTV